MKMKNNIFFYNFAESVWYSDIVYFILFLQFLLVLDKGKFRSLKLQAKNFYISEHNLCWKDPVDILLRCVDEEEAEAIATEMHEGVCGECRYWTSMTFIILREGYYWPMIFSDVFFHVRACVECQKLIEAKISFFSS